MTIKVTASNEEEVEAVRTASLDRRLAEALGGYPYSVWLGDTYRFGTPGTERGPEHAAPVGRHRAGDDARPAMARRRRQPA